MGTIPFFRSRQKLRNPSAGLFPTPAGRFPEAAKAFSADDLSINSIY